MIVKHEGTNLIMNPKREDFFEFFVQAIASIRRVKDCFEITDGIMNGDIDGFDGLDELEQNKFIDVAALENFAYKGFSKYQSIAVVIRYALGTIAGFNKMVSDFVDDGLFLADDECEQLNKMLNQIISELVYSIYYEFDIPTHVQKLEADEDYVDEIIKMYCDSYSIPMRDIITQIAEDKVKYPFRLSIFEDYPEYEADFEKIMGPLVGSLMENDKLTLEQVKDVINGKITPEALVESFSDDLGEMNSF
jgi:hypothetical protein